MQFFTAKFRRILLLIGFLTVIDAQFTNDFRAFIHNRYGIQLVNELERADLGPGASFGGRVTDGEVTMHGRVAREAVIIVHGITNRISRFQVRYG